MKAILTFGIYEGYKKNQEENTMGKNWFFRIKNVENGSYFLRDIIFNCKTKEEAKEKFLIKYKDNFENIKERVPKRGSDQLFTFFIKELDTHWDKYWLEELECPVCKQKFKRLEFNPNFEGFCSKTCKYANTMDLRNKRQGSEEIKNNYSAWLYKITHIPTGKFYIDTTEKWIMLKWWEHVKAKSNIHLHKFIKEHNITEFSFQILEEFDPKIKKSDKLKNKYIEEIKNKENCLNIKK